VKSALVIDDDPIVVKILSHALNEDGWEVFEASSGSMGLQLARKHKPDVVVCDLLMPKVNGYQVCRELRQDESLVPQPRIIVISNSNYASDRDGALASGADDFVLKPVKPVELLRLLNEASGSTVFMRMEQMGGPLTDTRVFSRKIGEGTRVRFWGVRGSIATPGPDTVKYGGNTTCVELRADGQLIILDAGTGIRQLGRRLMSEFRGDPINAHVLISHTHWDHIQGFPFFIPAYDPRNSVTVLGYEGAKMGLQTALMSQMESPYFPISMRAMPSNLNIEEISETEFHIGSIKVRTMFANHPGVCVGYRITTSAGTIVFMPDNEAHARQRMAADGGRERSLEVLEYARKQDEKLVDFIRDADIVIMDSQYDANEYKSHIGWGHSCVDDVVALAVVGNVRKLFLFHHDPDHDDEMIDRMEEWAQELAVIHGAKTEVAAAREGLEVSINFLDEV
jgi:phosphoribosyl 1,2-cyclic phosphodiesterase/CheY-like chemotaxis protein